MYHLVSGGIMALCWVMGVFFLRFWRRTQDRLFVFFSIAREEGRYLLTSDEQTARKAPGNLALLIRQDASPAEQLLQVLTTFSLVERTRSGKGFMSLCTECNSPIVPVQGHQVWEYVPGNVLNEEHDFHFCSYCEKVSWKNASFEAKRSWVLKLLEQ